MFESDISRSLFPGPETDMCMRLMWEHQHKLKTTDVFETCHGSVRSIDATDEDVYFKFVLCMVRAIRKASGLPSQMELLKRAILTSVIKFAFRTEADRKHHYNMVVNGGVVGYMAKYCYVSSGKCGQYDCHRKYNRLYN